MGVWRGAASPIALLNQRGKLPRFFNVNAVFCKIHVAINDSLSQNCYIMWTYECYINRDRPNLWWKWYTDHAEANSQHDAAFDLLEQEDTWRAPLAKTIKGKNFRGLIEVRLKAQVQWRILGFYQGKRHFIVTAIGYHKGRVYSPKSLLETAKKRMDEVKKDGSKAKRCERPQ